MAGSGRGINRALNRLFTGSAKTASKARYSKLPQSEFHSSAGAAASAEGIRRRRPQTTVQDLNASDAGVGHIERPKAKNKGVDPVLVGGVGGAVGSLAGGFISAITERTVQRVRDHGFTAPGTYYLGPGNQIHTAPGLNEADAIAKDHDIAYADAIARAQSGEITQKEFESIIREADQHTQKLFQADLEHSGSWHSWLGFHGIRFKSAVESVFGHQYPPWEDHRIDKSKPIAVKKNVFNPDTANYEIHTRYQWQGKYILFPF